MRHWLIRMRWPLAIAAVTVLLACLGLAAVYALTRYVAPAVTWATPPLACLYTQVVEGQKAPFEVLPTARMLIPLHGACAPERVTRYVTPALWGLVALVALCILAWKPCRKVGATVWYWAQGVGRLAPGTTHGRAKWATRHERRRRFHRRRGQVPYLAGVTGRFWWTRAIWLDNKAQNYNILIVGKPGVGKSSSQYVANMVRRARYHGTWWQRLLGRVAYGKAYVQPSGVATDPKGEFYARTARVFAENSYIVRCFDPYNPHGARYNPLAHMESETDYHRFARIVLRHRGGKMDAQSKEPFWDDTAELTMVASMAHLNHLARRQGRGAATLKELRDFVGRSDYAAMQQELMRSVPLARRMATQFMENVRKKPELEGSIQAGLPLLFGFLDDEDVVAATSGDDFDFHALGERTGKPWQIYYVLPPGREVDLAPLTIGLLDQIFDTLTVKVARMHGGTLPRPVIADLDEVGTIGHLGKLADWMNTMRSVGVWLRLACQYFGQIVRIYGPEEAAAIAEACQTQLYFGGAMVQEHGAELVSKQVGKTTIVSRGVNASRDREEYLVSQGGHTRTEQQAALMESDDFLRLPEHHMVIVPRHARPIKARAVAAEQARDVRPHLGGLPAARRAAPPAPPEREPHVFAAPGTPLRARPAHHVDWNQ